MEETANQIYNNDQAAELVGIAAPTIRTWKSRRASELQENVHWFASLENNGQTFWTEQGIEALQLIKNTIRRTGTETASDETTETGETQPVSETASETPSETGTSLLNRYDALVDAVADILAPGVIEQIDKAVYSRVRTAIAKPMTTIDCVAVLSDLGLKPANPAALLNGNRSAGLMAGGNDHDEPTSNIQ